jgi:hypothetical protein
MAGVFPGISPGIEGHLIMIPLMNIIETPAFHFNNDNAKIRRNHDKIRVPVVDVGLVIDEIIIGKFLQDGECAFLTPACFCKKGDRGCIRPWCTLKSNSPLLAISLWI